MTCLDPASRKSIGFFADNSRNTPIRTMQFSGGKEVVVKPETFYYIKDDKIIFEKGYQEFGIDAQRLNANLVEMRDDLFPILEKMIRENVQPQEPDTE